jgi:peptide/nickel transport system permease protein
MVVKRLALGLLTLTVVSLIIFLGVELLPGDLAEAILGQAATEETVAAFRRELKLDLPAHERYFGWLWGILQGDMGRSLANNREISELIGIRLYNTMFLAVVAAIISVPLAVTLGILAALQRQPRHRVLGPGLPGVAAGPDPDARGRRLYDAHDPRGHHQLAGEPLH